MTPSTSYAPPEPLFPSRYTVTRVLSEGANSTIYYGHDTEAAFDVALKCFDNNRHATYLREISVGFGLEHDHLAGCLDTFYLRDGRGCVVYEYVAGGTLQDWLQTHGPLDWREVVVCLRHLLSALQHLHETGRIHCDLKPENVFVARADLAETVFVLGDLGAACFIREAREGQHTTGSPAYIAPERLYDRFEYNSDLFSLGVLGYELCTGRRPFDGSAQDIARAHRSRCPDLSGIEHAGLSGCLEQLLAVDPQRRVADAKTALHILDHLDEQSQLTDSVEADFSAARLRTTIGMESMRSEHYGEFVLEHSPRTASVFNVGKRPQVCFEFQSHFEIVALPVAHAPDVPAPTKVIPSPGPVRALGDRHLAYATSTRIAEYDFDTGRSNTLLNHCSGVMDFYLNSGSLLWFSDKGGHLFKAQAEECTFRSAGYQPSKACLLDSGYFWTSGGPGNEQVTLRDCSANPVKTLALDGPVLDMVSADGHALALSMDASRSQQYSVWRLAEDSGIEPIKESLPRDVRHWYCTSGCVFWMTADADLHYSDASLLPRFVATLDIQYPELFCVSADGRFLAAVSTNHSGQHVLNVWQMETR